MKSIMKDLGIKEHHEDELDDDAILREIE
jgi:hypothetical protein